MTEHQQQINHIAEALKSQITPKRYQHIQGVVKSAVWLASKYGADPNAARIAALLHDYAKNYSKEELWELVEHYQLEVDPIMQHAYQLLHGKVAAAIAKDRFHITDQEILMAIESHTTGRPDMTKLEQIIYLADFIEPGRSYPAVHELRKIAEEDLERAVFKALNNTMIYVLRTKKLLHPSTLECRNKMLIRNPSLANMIE